MAGKTVTALCGWVALTAAPYAHASATAETSSSTTAETHAVHIAADIDPLRVGRPPRPGDRARGGSLPIPGEADRTSFPKDMAAIGALVGGLTPLVLMLPPWRTYLDEHTTDEVEDEGPDAAKKYLLTGSLASVVAAPAVGIGVFMATGGKEFRWKRAMAGGFAGSIIAWPIGLGLGAAIAKPMISAERGSTGEHNYFSGYAVGSIIWTTSIAAGAAGGIALGAGAEPVHNRKPQASFTPLPPGVIGPDAAIASSVRFRF